MSYNLYYAFINLIFFLQFCQQEIKHSKRNDGGKNRNGFWQEARSCLTRFWIHFWWWLLLDTERAVPIKRKYCVVYSLIRHNQHLFLTIWQYLKYEWWPEWFFYLAWVWDRAQHRYGIELKGIFEKPTDLYKNHNDY